MIFSCHFPREQVCFGSSIKYRFNLWSILISPSLVFDLLPREKDHGSKNLGKTGYKM